MAQEFAPQNEERFQIGSQVGVEIDSKMRIPHSILSAPAEACRDVKSGGHSFQFTKSLAKFAKTDWKPESKQTWIVEQWKPNRHIVKSGMGRAID
jgi:hypothetical protein